MWFRLLMPLLFCATLAAQAGVQVRGTRIVYEEARGETTALVRYLGGGPAMLQIWMVDAVTGDEQVPFIVTPVVSRMEPGQEQMVRILRTREGLPQDRESLFYFNVLEVPPEPTALIANNEPFLQLTMQGQFKFFYRPRGLKLPPDRAAGLLRFSGAPPAADGRLQVRVQNPSPYHVTFAEVKLHPPGSTGAPLMQLAADVTPGERMVAPGGELLLRLDGTSALPAGAELEIVTINDLGGRPTLRKRIG